MKTLKGLLVLAANLFAYCFCWAAYGACKAGWWLATEAPPAALRWARDQALPAAGSVLLALAGDVVALLGWLSRAARDPGAAARRVRGVLAEIGAAILAWAVSLAWRAARGANYSGKCRRF